MKLAAWLFVLATFAAFILYAVSAMPEPTPLIEQVDRSTSTR